MDPKLKAVRAGHRGNLTKLFRKFEELKAKGEPNQRELSILVDSANKKKETLEGLNQKILDMISEEEVAQELDDQDEYAYDLEFKLREMSELLDTLKHGNQQTHRQDQILNPHANSFVPPSAHATAPTHSIPTHEPTHDPPQSIFTHRPTHDEPQSIPTYQTHQDPSQPSTSCNYTSQSTHISQNPPSTSFSSTPSDFHKLPKLNLPTFDGDILAWPSFWDSYDSAIHSNPSLSDVQKYNYLKSLLYNDALQTIAGLSMTNANYAKAISLLQERYGQDHKIIQTYMQALLDLQAPVFTLHSLRTYYDKMESYVRGLESLGQTGDQYGSLLVPVILNKLPEEVRQNLARAHRSTSWQLCDLRKAILDEVNIMEAGKLTSRVETLPATAAFLTNTKRIHKPTATAFDKINKTCAFCKDPGHTALSCTKYTTIKARMSVVKKERLCFNCLGKHKLSDCKSKGNCRNCKKRHHTSICDESQPKEETKPQVENSNTILQSSLMQHNNSILLKTAVAMVSSEKCMTEANILLDEGAQRTFITESLANKLQLTANGNELVHLSGFGEHNRQVRHLKTATIYLNTDNGNSIPMNVLVIPEIAVPIRTHIQSVADLKHLRGLKLAHPVTHDEIFEIDILIGADYYWTIVGDRIIRGNGPTAVESCLGYLLSGPATSTTTSTGLHSSIFNVIVSHKAEEMNIAKFWEIESIGVDNKNIDFAHDQFQEEYQKSSIVKDGNKYVAKLPWKSEHPILPLNKTVALRRTRNVVNRLSAEPILLQKYDEIIQDQLRRGFIEKVDDYETPDRVHYIPHHPVRKDSPTTPIRIVYDCSCKSTQDSASLNDCLLDVPPKLNDVTSILLRFRMNRYAVCTDIEKAFLNVGLDEKDRDVTRFFWLSDINDPNSYMSTYRFKSVLFGATCSPFILNAVLLKHLNDNRNTQTERLISDLYVDNIVSSFSTEKELAYYFESSRTLFADGGFNLRSWSSNSTRLKNLAEKQNVLDKDQNIKVLGMRWNSINDTLSFGKCQILDIKDEITKREVLKQSARIYDPLGLISPVSVRGKMFLQTLWQQRLEWDEVLPSEIATKWTEIAHDIQDATTITARRHYFENCSDTNSDTIVHIFTDASMKAYGACAYIVANGESALMMSRNRVAPLKNMTIPRLELMAAVIGSRLLEHILNQTGIKQAILWSDSQIVLSWISSNKKLKPFVENRVKEIRELTEEFTWRYCPTDNNPADLLSRGISTDKLKDNKLWYEGPSWITNEKDFPQWNIDNTQVLANFTQAEFDDKTNETHKESPNMIGIRSVIKIDRFSSFRKLIRVLAYIRRFIKNCRNEKKTKGTLTTSELQAASILLIQDAQHSHYSDIIENLCSRDNTKHNLVKQLKLFLDQEGLIRSEGRIHNAPLDNSTKFPLLLPARDELTQLIIMDAHITHMHSGLNSTVTLLRQTYWIPTIRQIVKGVIHKCVSCKKVSGRPYNAPDPPPLPKDRLRESPPFTVTGIDFTGALNIREKNGNVSKAYICLFTCASTRAVHLEVVSDLTEEMFVLAFRRFCSRKSVPQIVISDNATTFTSSAKHIEELTRSKTLAEKLNNFGTSWKFIPKRAPWYGGWWERLVGLTKECIKKVLGRALINIELLRTIVTEIETILNDRPLTYVSSDPTDEEPLTPSHLLYGRRITALPYPNNSDVETENNTMNHESVNKLFRFKTQLIQRFWIRWKHEYLTSLREYQRNSGKDNQTIKEGDVVQVHDDQPRTKWTLAIVEELNTGNDGKVRSAVIRTKKGLTSRPIVKLYPLEITCNRKDDKSETLCRNSKMRAIEKIKMLNV